MQTALADHAIEQSTATVRAVIYTRISSVAQAQKGHGLASQETRCREFAKMKRYTVEEVFSDSAVSGGVVDRPGIQAMLAFLRKHARRGEFVVVIDDISRIARDIEAHLQLRRAIQATGAKLESPSIEFGEDSDSILVENLLASVSQHQRQKNAEQTRNRMRARLMNGYWPFISCIGFKYEKVAGRGKMLVRDEPLASIIAEGLEGYASGRFQIQAEVKRFFESHPSFPRDAGGFVRNQKVTDILTQPLYAGYVEHPDWGVSLRKGQHEGLVNFETFERIQARLKESAKAPARADIDEAFPLRGLVACACCGGPLTACWSKSKTGKRHPYYMCFKKGCPEYRKSIKKAELETAFTELLEGVRPSKQVFDIAAAMFKDAWDRRLAKSKAMAAQAKRELQKLDAKIEKLLERIVDASTDTLVKSYEARIVKLEREKLLWAEKAENTSGPRRRFGELFELSMTFLANPCNLWRSERLSDKQTVLKLVFSQRLAYCRKGGFRTPQVSVPFMFLGDFAGKCEMADREGFEPSRRLPAYTRSRRAPSTTRPPVHCCCAPEPAVQRKSAEYSAGFLKRN